MNKVRWQIPALVSATCLIRAVLSTTHDRWDSMWVGELDD
jgi:hypothetical protein